MSSRSAIERRLSSTGSWTLLPWRARTRGSCSTSRPRSSCSRSATATLTGFCKGGATLARLIARVRSGDLSPKELIVGGLDPGKGEGQQLKELGVEVHDGVRKAVESAKKRIGGKS